MISVKAPGKLYIAGEYAVVENGYPAIIVAIDQYITANISESENNVGVIHSKQYENDKIEWVYDNNQIKPLKDNSSFNYVISAMKTFETYVKELNINHKLYNIDIDSNLNSEDGKKYGLGSSAAVTVATIKALNELYGLHLSKLQIFKLAAIAHLRIQGNGSLGDVAASSFGGWIAYSSFDKKWLANQTNLKDVMEQSWPHLMIEQLTPPSDLELLIGWTGTPASTSNLLKSVESSSNVDRYKQFLVKSKRCINKMINGFKNKDIAVIKNQIKENRSIIVELASFTGIDIETSKLKRLCEIAEEYNGSGKSSGAGGGDCGIAIVEKQSPIKDIELKWTENGIIPLHLNIYSEKEA
ncbi:phosphomevalonate kinase [Apilactobacillus kunkeei]|uniref:phosphomevalonate kinase n=1 Tax=Apilactobacillus kunkeei TaxID=148814 RepID=UPI002009FB09|nr:phosphomevalonate kinase [Apilactobacillus kunkeei]MCK8634798.1 phosphomevalonate kinase [Apilactobacillus kunkeei]